ncbi:hypothetical protein ACMFMG_001294 [Clarireedia jacksonii]
MSDPNATKSSGSKNTATSISEGKTRTEEKKNVEADATHDESEPKDQSKSQRSENVKDESCDITEYIDFLQDHHENVGKEWGKTG